MVERLELDSELIEVNILTLALLETLFTHVEGINLVARLFDSGVQGGSLLEELIEGTNVVEGLDSLESVLVASKVLKELFLLSIELGDEVVLLGTDGGLTVSDSLTNDHGVLFECPAVLDVILTVHVGEIIEELVVLFDLLLELEHLHLGHLLGGLDEDLEGDELFFVLGHLADALLHSIVGG